MGVDARMTVKVPQRLTEEEVRRLAADLAEAFSRKPFWIQPPGPQAWKAEGQHALALRSSGTVGCVLTVNLCGRFYGVGYERGDWPTFAAITHWLRLRLPGATVFYGGDGDERLEEMSLEFETVVWAHFAQHGHRPYTGAFSMPGDPTPPICGFCRVAMHGGSWGPGPIVGFSCPSCGFKSETEDMGKIFRTVQEKES